MAFETGDLVWGKMKYSPFWPAQIVAPKDDIKKPSTKNANYHFLLFFGTKDHSWLPEDSLCSFSEFRTKHGNPNRPTKQFSEAVAEADELQKTMPVKESKSLQSISDLPSIDDELQEIKHDKTTSSSQKNTSITQAPKAPKKPPKPKETPQQTDKSPQQRKPTDKVILARKRPFVNKKDTPSNKKAKFLIKMNNSDSPSKRRLSDPISKKQYHAKVLPRPSLPNARPKYIPESPDKQTISSTAHIDDQLVIPRPRKPIIATPLRIGFLGLGLMGSGVVMNLLSSGHEVMVWNRTGFKCRNFVEDGALRGSTPADVVRSSDIIFSCVADPNASKDLVFGNSGVLQEITSGKSYVDMTTVDVDTAEEINEAIIQRGGRFLEAPIVGSKVSALEGDLIILSSGDKELYDDCYSCFCAMAKRTFFLGEVGAAARMKLVISVMYGTVMSGIGEAMALAEKSGLDQEDVMAIAGMSSISSPFLKHKTQAIINHSYEAHFPLQHQQKDLRLATLLGDQVEQPLYVTASANEMFKKARRFGYGSSDVSAVYRAANA